MVYVLSAIGFFIGLLIKTLLYAIMTLRASSRLHNRVFAKIMRAPMQFFDTTPTGRVLNRFSKDLDEIDSQLPWTADIFLQNISQILLALGFISVIFPYFLIAVVPLSIVFFLLNRFFRRSVRELKRLDGTTRSPIFSQLTATVQGLATLHAYGKMDEFNVKFRNSLDANQQPYFMYFCANRWLSVRLDMITVAITTVTAILVVFTAGVFPAAYMALALSYAMRVRIELKGTWPYAMRVRIELRGACPKRFLQISQFSKIISLHGFLLDKG